MDRHSFILVCLVAVGLAELGSTSKLRPTRLSKTAENTCTTNACKEAAYLIEQAMDTSADPCTDFYQFACGNYAASRPEEVEIYSTFEDQKELNKKLKIIFEEPHQRQDPAMYKLTKDYYASCVNTTSTKETGLQPVLNLLKHLGGWPVAESSWNETTSHNWTAVLYKLMDRGLGYDYIFQMRVDFDCQDTSYRPLLIDVPKIDKSMRSAQIIKLAEDLGANPKQAANDMQDVLELREKLIQAQERSRSEEVTSFISIGPKILIMKPSTSKKSTFFSRYLARPLCQEEIGVSQIDMQKLNQELPSVNWNVFFKKSLQAESLENLHIVSSKSGYIKRAIKILDSTSKRIVINYLLLLAVKQLNGWYEDNQKSSEDECVQETGFQFPLLTANIIWKNVFTKETNELAGELIQIIKKAFNRRMQHSAWMDEATKQAAIDKLTSMDYLLVCPDAVKDVQLMEKFHSDIKVRSNAYLENNLLTKRFLHKIQMSTFRMSPKESYWISDALVLVLINAFYDPNANSIEITAGILQGAFFDVDRPQYLNFGSVGGIIGHELTHGFDTQGSRLNQNGVKKEWWTAETRIKFNEKAKCLEHQFNAIYVPEIDRWLNGTKTLAENIADNGGFRHAYEAYEYWMKANHPEPLLPGLNFNQKQLFWLSAANIWCEKIHRNVLLKQVEKGDHSPSKYRVKIAFQNFDEFAKDFGCLKGSPMNPTKKCQVW